MHVIIPVVLFAVVAIACAAPAGNAAKGVSVLTAVPFTDVDIRDRFWSPRLETNRTVTIPYCCQKCEETGRLSNFAKAAGLMEGPHIGHRFNDSDVFKVIEGAAYSLRVQRDAELEAFLDGLIEDIAAAQEEDGYLFTTRTIDPENPADASGETRWSYVIHSHELYNVGHMYEAAVAYYMATGKRELLDVALRNADLIDEVFGPDGRRDAPGHEEIEIGLVRLYQATGEDRYLDLAKFFIDERGNAEGHELYGPYAQDHLPVIEQTEPVGHAVRAMYLYCGMADVAAVSGDGGYMKALDAIWDNMVRTKLYLTGGIGARQSGEAFGEDYELPNASAYNETCAAIGNALWNHRMNLLHADGKYVDVLERVIYNGFLSGISMSGDRFFYPNPLASGGSYHRSPWFSCSCCPVNVVRFVPSIAGYVYAAAENAIYVNLYVAGEATVALGNNNVRLAQDTDYPWDGRVEIGVEPDRDGPFEIKVRIPGWATGSPVPGELYKYVDDARCEFKITVNGEPVKNPEVARGYVSIGRTWKRGDRITVEFAMPVHLVECDMEVEDNRGRLAIERGPIVYCLEAVDNGGHVRNIWMPDDATLEAEAQPGLLGGVTVIRGNGFALHQDQADEPPVSEAIEFTAVPYYAWDHREPGEMEVWIAAKKEAAEVVPPPTVASRSKVRASHCWERDSVKAVNDQQEPKSSADDSIPRMTFWNHKGTAEWIEYQFDEERWVSRSSVYWFDDGARNGGCRVPKTWRFLFLEDGHWKPAPAASRYAVVPDTFNEVEFDPVKTSAVRLEIQLQDGYSGGILEWRIDG